MSHPFTTVPLMTQTQTAAKPALPDGLVAIVKRDCPTCELVEPVLGKLASSAELAVFTQDDPSFPESLAADARHFDDDLAVSWHYDVDTVPTLMLVKGGEVTDRTVGWSREQWEALTGIGGLGEGLPEMRPGCGSLSVAPEMTDTLASRFGDELGARSVPIASAEDVHEAMYARGWSDGLPLVPPTDERVRRMLTGTSRAPDEVVAVVPPDLAECTVTKVAINAVMAGCRPEYLPVVLAAVEAVCTDTFNMHGLLATTMPVGPVFVVNGPIRHEIDMNSGHNVLGQGNRANSTIGRAVQLVVRNVGGGRPGDVDRAALGQPGKVGFCFAENEEDSPWMPLSSDFGFEAGVNTVTAFAGEAPRSVVDQMSRDPESLSRSLAAALIGIHHPKLTTGFDALLVVAPDQARIYREAGWTREQTAARINELTERPGSELVQGAGGIAEGLPESMADMAAIAKFKPDGLHLIYAGGGAGLFSAIIGSWVNGAMGSQKRCVPIDGWR